MSWFWLSEHTFELQYRMLTCSFSFMQCPPSLDEQNNFRAYRGAANGLSTGLLVGLNLDTSSPDTFRPPPAPIPFNVLFGRPQTPLRTLGCQGPKCDATKQSKPAAVGEIAGADGSNKLISGGHVGKSEGKTLADILLASPTKSDVEISKSSEAYATEEEDACPICLEGVRFSTSDCRTVLVFVPVFYLTDELLVQNMTLTTLKWSQIVSMIFTCHVFLSGWKEVIPVQFVIRSVYIE